MRNIFITISLLLSAILFIHLKEAFVFNIFGESNRNNLLMDEICDNGIDDDLDGLIDELDPDCILWELDSTTGIVQNGIAAITCGVLTSDPPLQQFTFGLMNLNNPPYFGDQIWNPDAYHHPSWRIDSIGNVFGIEHDDLGNIYLAATSSFPPTFGSRYGEIGGGADDLGAAGTIYKIDRFSGQATVFAQLPQQSSTVGARTTGVGLGDLTFDQKRQQFFVTNMEDGKIYRLDIQGNILDTYDPLTPDDGTPGLPPLGDRAWALDIYGDLLYYSIWTANATSGTKSTVRAIVLDGAGTFMPITDNLVYDGSDWYYPSPIQSINFSEDGRMMLSTGNMSSNFSRYNHFGSIIVLENEGSGWNKVKAFKPGNNSSNFEEGYGGADWAPNGDFSDQLIWATSADMQTSAGPHGIEGVLYNNLSNAGVHYAQPTGGSTIVPTLSSLGDEKGSMGDIEIFYKPPTPSDAVISDLKLFQNCAANEPIELEIIIENIGAGILYSETPLSVYNANPTTETAIRIGSTTIGNDIGSGGKDSSSLILYIDPSTIPTFYVVLNDDGSMATPLDTAAFPLSVYKEESYSNNLDSISNSLVSCPEICDNGIDDDFDGFIDYLDMDCPVSSCAGAYELVNHYKYTDTSANFAFPLDGNDYFGQSVSPIGDFNNDGVPDLVVSAYLDDDGGSNSGAFYIIQLQNDFSIDSVIKISNIPGILANDYAGSISNLGDLDKDGIPDFIIGAYGDDAGGSNAGAVHILFMNRDGSVKNSIEIDDTDLPNAPLVANDYFGNTVSGIGDLNKDGIPDAVVGAYNEDDGGTNRGAIYILFLNEDGSVKNTNKIADGLGGILSNTLDNSDEFGYSVAMIGDIDQDGIQDIAVGASKDEATNSPSASGAAYILFMQIDGSVREYTKIGSGQSGFPRILDANDYFGSAVSTIGDYNADGIPDLIVGAIGDDDGSTDRGAAYILYLKSDGTVGNYFKISDTAGNFNATLDNSDSFGTSVSAIGDINGDGTIDLAVSATGDDDGGSAAGAVYILSAKCSSFSIGDKIWNDLDGDGTQNLGLEPGIGGININLYLDDGDGIPELGTEDSVVQTQTTNSNGFYKFENHLAANYWIQVVDEDIQLSDYTKTGGNPLPELIVFDGLSNYLQADYGYKENLTPSCLALPGVITTQKINNTEHGLVASDYFGAVSGAGDIDGDGINDLIVGTKRDGSTDRGAVYILFLNSDGTVRDEQKISDTEGLFDAPLANSDYFGANVANIGDINGDGINDIIVGAYKDDNSGTNSGTAYIIFLNADGTSKHWESIENVDLGTGIDQLTSYDYFGSSVAGIGDLDGDGINDVAIGAPGEDYGSSSNQGRIHILFLNSNGTVKRDTSIGNTELGGTELNNTDYFGSSISLLGDVDGDGVQDIAVGNYLDDDGGTDVGSIYILFMNTDGTLKSYQKISDIDGGFNAFASLNNNDYFGYAVEGLGDINKDNIPDLAVSAPLSDSIDTDLGLVYFILLNADGTVKALSAIGENTNGFTEELDASDYFGSHLGNLGDINSDGNPDLAIGAIYDDDITTNSGAVYISTLQALAPDGHISSISISQNCAEGAPVQMQLAIENIGDATLLGQTPVAIYNANPFTENAVRVHVFNLGQDIPIGETDTIAFAIFTDPENISAFYVLLNDDGSTPTPLLTNNAITNFQECDYANNIDSISNTLSSCPEICGNGFDDDFDGKADGFDEECLCSPDESGGLYSSCATSCFVITDLGDFDIQQTATITGGAYFNTLVGDMDNDDVPDIVIGNGQYFDGISHTLKGSITRLGGGSGGINGDPFLIADLDKDGDLEFVSANATTIAARHHDNTLLWSTTLPYNITTSARIHTADFNHDSIPEVYLSNIILNGESGAILLNGGIDNHGGYNDASYKYRSTIAADVMGDNRLELIAGHTVYDVRITNTNSTFGNTLTPNTYPDISTIDGMNFVADMDLDGKLDIITCSAGLLNIWNPRTATLIATYQNTSNIPTPMIGNVDDDPYPEFAFLYNNSQFGVFDIDGNNTLTLKWSAPAQDGSQVTGATMFDFNADGKQEINYKDQTKFRVFDGNNGTVLATYPLSSSTYFEYPVIADIDNDNEAEIVVSSNSATHIFESDQSTWAATRPIWNQYVYRTVAINDDGKVPVHEVNAAVSYSIGNQTFRPYNSSLTQKSPTTREGESLGIPTPDLAIINTTLSQNCQAGQPIQLHLTISNQGAIASLPYTPISIYAGNPTQAGANLLKVDNSLESLSQGDTIPFEITVFLQPEDYDNTLLYIVINDEGSNLPIDTSTFPLECNYGNNIDSVFNSLENCPEICDNGFDDDFDDKADAFDEDCPCNPDQSGGLYTHCGDCLISSDLGSFDIQRTATLPGVHNYGIVLVGDIDGDGTPDIIVGDPNDTYKRVYDGITKDLKFTITSDAPSITGFAIADVDRDGDMEIFQGATCREHDNTLRWTSSADINTPHLADFNHDSIPEIYSPYRGGILNAQTGVVLLENVSGSVAADVFPGGNLELIAGNIIYEINITNTSGTEGNTVIAHPSSVNQSDGPTYVADMDLDGLLDVITYGSNIIKIRNPRTDVLMSSGSSSGSGPLLIANMDEDPYPEIAKLWQGTYLRAYNYDNNPSLSLKWQIAVSDASSRGTGASLFDFNADGISEIVYRDEVYLRVINAATGGVIALQSAPSWTLLEYPIIADIDNDNEAEIVVTSGPFGTFSGSLYVFESNINPWAPTRPIWNQFQYRAVAVNDDGTIPVFEANAANAYVVNGDTRRPYNHVFTQTPPANREGITGIPVPDATPTLVTILNNGCYSDTTIIELEISNIGAATLKTSMPISIYKGNPTNPGATFIQSDLLGVDVTEGTSILDTLDIPGIIEGDTLYFVLNDNASQGIPIDTASFPVSPIIECDYTNNIISIVVNCIQTDTIIVHIPLDIPTDTCLTQFLEIENADTFIICYDDTSTVVGSQGNTSECVRLDPKDSWAGTDTICTVVCDTAAMLCDTTIVIVIVKPQTDTIRLSIPPPLSTDTCLVDLLELSGSPDTLIICREDATTVTASEGLLTECIRLTPVGTWSGTDTICTIVCDTTPLLDVCDTTIIIVTVLPGNIKVLPRVFLSGPYDPLIGLMTDNLRTQGIIPLIEPFESLPEFYRNEEGNEVIFDSLAVFSVTGNDAIVDWILVELRDKNDSTFVLETKAALLQRDGDVVDFDGFSPLTFNSLLDDYYLAIRHRNHLGAMTKTPVALTYLPKIVDFTTNLPPNGVHTWGFMAQHEKGGIFALWPGNSEIDRALKFEGGQNDKNRISATVISAPENNSYSSNFIYRKYHVADINMDGLIKFEGGQNDKDMLSAIIVQHALNTTYALNFIIREQLPE